MENISSHKIGPGLSLDIRYTHTHTEKEITGFNFSNFSTVYPRNERGSRVTARAFSGTRLAFVSTGDFKAFVKSGRSLSSITTRRAEHRKSHARTGDKVEGASVVATCGRDLPRKIIFSRGARTPNPMARTSPRYYLSFSNSTYGILCPRPFALELTLCPQLREGKRCWRRRSRTRESRIRASVE